MKVLSRVGIAVTTPLLIFTVSVLAHAQGDARSNRTTPAERNPSPRVIYVDRPGPARERIVRILPKTGTLTVVAESGASVRLQYLNRSGEVVKEYKGEGYTIGSAERSIIFKNLPPGQYQVAAELDGYRPATSHPVKVIAGNAAKVDLILEEITYTLTVRLNAGSGTLRYAKGDEISRSVSFQNGVAVLSGLTGGDYTLEIVPDDASFKRTKTTRRVSGDDQVRFDLERLESRAFLGATASEWSLPPGWSFSSGKVIVHGVGMALPRDLSYSNYTNFQLSADVRMMNGVAASFAVRMADPQNYYLVEITGPDADEPYVLRGFIVKNGVAQRFGRTFPISQFSETVKPRKFFHVVLTMADADADRIDRSVLITVWVQDSETGDLRKLGILPDPSRTFRIGAVGIAARAGEQNEVSQFAICVSGCVNP